MIRIAIMTKPQLSYASCVLEFLNAKAELFGYDGRVTYHEVSRCFHDSHVLCRELEDILTLIGDDTVVAFIRTVPGIDDESMERNVKTYLERRRYDPYKDKLKPMTLPILVAALTLILLTFAGVGCLVYVAYTLITGIPNT